MYMVHTKKKLVIKQHYIAMNLIKIIPCAQINYTLEL